MHAAAVAVLLVCAFSVIRPQEKNALFYFNQGQSLLEKKDYRSAVFSFRTALERNPRFSRAALGAARCYFFLGDMERSRENYEVVLRLENKNIEAMTGLARVLVRSGRVDRALEYLKEVSSVDPGNTENNFAFGEMYLLTGRRNLALSYFEKVIRNSPAHIPSLLGLARLSAENGRFDDADRYVRKARQIDPIRADVHSAAGQIHLSQALLSNDENEKISHLDLAYDAFRTVLQLDPQNLDAEKRIIWISLYRNHIDECIHSVESMLARYPDNAQFNYFMGNLVRLRSPAQSRNGIGFMRKAVQLDSSDSFARFGLEESLRDFSGDASLSSLRGELANYHLARMRYYASINRADHVVTHLNRSIAIDSDNQNTLRQLMDLDRRNGNYESFMKNLLKLRRLNPDDARLRNLLEYALREKNKSLPYRENLLSPEVSPQDATFQRTPTRIFIYDFRPSDPFPYNPDSPGLIASALAFQLRITGRIKPVTDEFNSAVRRSIRRSNSSSSLYSYGVYYTAENISLLEDQENNVNQSAYVIHGSFQSGPTGYTINYEAMEKNSGRRVDIFSLSASGTDAIYELSIRAAARLTQMLPYGGKIIKIRPGEIFINLGRIDSVQRGDKLIVSRLNNETPVLRVEEVSMYVSRCVTVGADWNLFLNGDAVRIKK